MSRRYEVMFSEKAARDMFIRQRVVLSETPIEKQKWVFSGAAWVEASPPARSAAACVASAAVESVPGLSQPLSGQETTSPPWASTSSC